MYVNLINEYLKVEYILMIILCNRICTLDTKIHNELLIEKNTLQ